MDFCTVAVFMTAAVIFVNGATDAPTSMAPAVASGKLSFPTACLLCALFNFLGMLFSGMYFPAVAESMAELSDLTAVGTVCALLSVVIFSSAAWACGIPTSESHGLIAAVGGVSLYFAGSVGSAYIDICIKSVLSCATGFFAGAGAYVLLSCFPCVIYSGEKRGSIISAFFCSASSFWHGAQDGQKFMFLLCSLTGTAALSTSAYVICSLIMGIGCLAGGRKIINKTGLSLTGGLGGVSAAASETASLACTAVSSVLGIPVSTTYMKTSSMLGASAAGGGAVNKRCAAELLFTWLLTYPCCMGVSYCLCCIAERVF
ncbi:MAG: inorganic phosphate transporter [Clostridia bacterium]|nr:inorganic phosphate transporter [Clostridia bacterium]